MCGRYAFAEKPENIYTNYKVPKIHSLPQLPLYNISPGSFCPVITKNGEREMHILRWGLIPRWAKDPRIGYKLINARAESANEKPSFKDSFHNRRCLIPATGFYEWKDGLPYYIRLKSQNIFSMGGIYDYWKDGENQLLQTFAVITTSANQVIEKVHNRMPVIIEKQNENLWLDQTSDISHVISLLKPYKNEQTIMHRVSTSVNETP